jgi:hypothetical protein
MAMAMTVESTPGRQTTESRRFLRGGIYIYEVDETIQHRRIPLLLTASSKERDDHERWETLVQRGLRDASSEWEMSGHWRG